MGTQPVQPVLDVAFGGTDNDVVLRAAHDAVEVPPQIRAVCSKDFGLATESFRRAVEVGVGGVTGGDAQGLPLSAAGDPQRDTAGLDRKSTRLNSSHLG